MRNFDTRYKNGWFFHKIVGKKRLQNCKNEKTKNEKVCAEDGPSKLN